MPARKPAGNPDKIVSPLMTIDEVADYLRTHPTTVYRMAREGRIPAFRLNSAWRFHKQIIDDWMAGKTVRR
jgi:excisionase family DNA binding protein